MLKKHSGFSTQAEPAQAGAVLFETSHTCNPGDTAHILQIIQQGMQVESPGRTGGAVQTQHLQVQHGTSSALEPFGSTCGSKGIPNIPRFASTGENSSWTEDSSP